MAVRPAAAGIDLDGLFRAHATPLLRLAVVLTGDQRLAEDLVQEAFVRLHRSGTHPAPGTEPAYLRRTVVNLSHGHHRRLRTARNHPPDPPRAAPAAEVDAVRRDGHRQVVEAVRALPRRQRDCVVLHYFAELTDAQIADALGISAGSVKTHLHRA
jgi:RNA polymerase sigma-70 factor (sigma-E family)